MTTLYKTAGLLDHYALIGWIMRQLTAFGMVNNQSDVSDVIRMTQSHIQTFYYSKDLTGLNGIHLNHRYHCATVILSNSEYSEQWYNLLWYINDNTVNSEMMNMNTNKKHCHYTITNGNQDFTQVILKTYTKFVRRVSYVWTKVHRNCFVALSAITQNTCWHSSKKQLIVYVLILTMRHYNQLTVSYLHGEITPINKIIQLSIKGFTKWKQNTKW